MLSMPQLPWSTFVVYSNKTVKKAYYKCPKIKENPLQLDFYELSCSIPNMSGQTEFSNLAQLMSHDIRLTMQVPWIFSNSCY